MKRALVGLLLLLLAGCRGPALTPTSERLAPVARAQPCTSSPPPGATELGELEVPGYPYPDLWLAEAAARGADLIEVRGGLGPLDLGPFGRGRLALYRVRGRPPAPALEPCPSAAPDEVVEAPLRGYGVARVEVEGSHCDPWWARELARRWYGGAWRGPKERDDEEEGPHGPEGLLLLLPQVHGSVDATLFGAPPDARWLCLRLRLLSFSGRLEGEDHVLSGEVEWTGWDGQDGRLLLHRRTRAEVRRKRYGMRIGSSVVMSNLPVGLATNDDVIAFLVGLRSIGS